MSVMSQQVNLLLDDLRPQRTWLTPGQVFVSVAAFALALVALSLHGLLKISSATDERDALAGQLAVLADANTKARASINSVEEPTLAAHVADLRTQLHTRSVLAAALRGTSNGRSAGFANHLDELAATGQAGLWLTDIELSGGGNHTRLAGMTLDAVLVPRFLQQLGRGGQFAGQRFDAFELAAGESGALRFTITGPDGDAK